MATKSTTYSALAVCMVAGGLICLHYFRNLNAASATDPPPPNTGPASPFMAVFDAIGANDLKPLAAALALKPNLEQAGTSDAFKGLTPLQFAGATGAADAVRALIAAGAKPDTATPDGRTPLMLAAGANRPDAIARLAEGGAAIDARDSHGRTALMNAVAGNHIEAAQALLAAGASVNPADEQGVTALGLAATGTGDAKILQRLLESGADTEAAGADGITALMQAARTGTAEKAIALLNAGANPAAKSKEGKTAGDYAKARKDDQAKLIAQVLPG